MPFNQFTKCDSLTPKDALNRRNIAVYAVYTNWLFHYIWSLFRMVFGFTERIQSTRTSLNLDFHNFLCALCETLKYALFYNWILMYDKRLQVTKKISR